jgi:hypothetical protein
MLVETSWSAYGDLSLRLNAVLRLLQLLKLQLTLLKNGTRHQLCMVCQRHLYTLKLLLLGLQLQTRLPALPVVDAELPFQIDRAFLQPLRQLAALLLKDRCGVSNCLCDRLLLSPLASAQHTGMALWSILMIL